MFFHYNFIRKKMLTEPNVLQLGRSFLGNKTVALQENNKNIFDNKPKL